MVCKPPVNSGGSLPDGFIKGVNPANGAAGVPLSLNSIKVTFTQAMNAADNQGLYDIRNVTSGKKVKINSVTYHPADFSLTIAFDTGKGWDPNSDYQITYKKSLDNVCGTKQGHDVTTTFKTGSTNTRP